MRNCKATMYPLIREYEESSQSCKAFCSDRSMNYGTFQYWIKKYRSEQEESVTGGFGSIEFHQGEKFIRIQTSSGVNIEVPI